MNYLKRTTFALFMLFHFGGSMLIAQNTPCDYYYEDEDWYKAACEEPFPLPHKLYVGPEIYHIKRTREGGTRQSGEIYGVRAGYDYIKRYSLYLGFDTLYASGTIDGKTHTEERLKSTFTDREIEGRIGYTFQAKSWVRPALTPFVGYGSFKETNKFRHPSLLRLKFRTRYHYFTTGFLSTIDLSPNLTLGANLKVRFTQDATCKVSDDPDLEDVTLHIRDKVNYRIELPVSYRFCSFTDHLELDLVPFYEFRHYGGREDFPFNFSDTKLRLYGISIQFTCRI